VRAKELVVSELVRLGWQPFFEDQRAKHDDANWRVARVVQEQRGLYHVAGEYDGPAEVTGRYRHSATRAADFPAVGDWVGVRVEPGDERGLVEFRFERRGALSRKAAGRTTDEQVLAANVDVVFLVTSLVGDFNARRVERYMTLAWESGAAPVVLLNKADLSDDSDVTAEALRARIPFVDVLVVSALTHAGLDALAAHLQPARTVVLLGSSGAGKSTLVNALVGHDRQTVGRVREDDQRGRHTTTHRELIELPGGALLIDTPGMRELQPWSDEAAVADTFDDVTDLAARCRFSDCAHASEPGCAVLAAVAAGTLAEDRLENYRRLAREAAYLDRRQDKAAAADQKRRLKRMHQAIKEMYRQRNRS
jgi:ribosome biogenesis GTPase / thiamine phosphate phosphatase